MLMLIIISHHIVKNIVLQSRAVLKALCHAIRADCLLMKPLVHTCSRNNFDLQFLAVVYSSVSNVVFQV